MAEPSSKKKTREGAAAIAKILEVLHSWGIHSLGQLAALEKDQLIARLGPEALRLWECARGKSRRLLRLMPPVESFSDAFEFENEIETSEPLLFILRRFLEQLSSRLGPLHLVVRELMLCLSFSDKNHYERVFKIPEPTRNVEMLFRMLHTHLENFKSEFPIVAVSLTAQPAQIVPQQFGFFSTALRDPAQLSETLAQLVGLLAHDHVGTPVLEDTHRSDAFHMTPFCWQMDEIAQVEHPLPAFALRRFRKPISTTVLLAASEPASLRSAKINQEVEEMQGPFHSSGDWWDAQAWSRAEWDLQLKEGQVCRCHRQGNAWKLDGIYD